MALVLRLLLLFPLMAWADGARTPEEWLNLISSAAHQSRYTGVYVTEQDGRIETFRIFHVPGDARSERTHIISLDGPHREIVRTQDETRFYIPLTHTVRIEAGSKRYYFPTLIEKSFNSYLDLYNLEVLGQGRVAGADCQWLRFNPRDDFRYAHQICVDKNSGLLLRADSLGPDGQPLRTSFFTQLVVGPGSMEEQSLGIHNLDDWRVQKTSQSDIMASDWRITALPPGFRKLTEVKMRGGRQNEPMIHQVYSDGLASVSVFIEADGNQAHLEHPHSPFRSMNIYHLDVNDHKVFLVGEVPPDTLERMGQSLVYSIRSQHP